MPFTYDSTGVSLSAFRGVPEGEYSLKIVDAKEGQSKAGNHMIVLDLAVIENDVYAGNGFKHWVVFLPPGTKGDSMNVHFRKCIGVPWDGPVKIDPTNWIGKKFRAKVIVEDTGTHKNNKITRVMPYGDDFPAVEAAEPVPF